MNKKGGLFQTTFNIKNSLVAITQDQSDLDS